MPKSSSIWSKVSKGGKGSDRWAQNITNTWPNQNNFQFSPGAAQPTTVTTTGPTGKPRVTITEFDSSPLNQRSLKSPGTSSSGTPCTPPPTSGDKHRRYSMASRVSNFSYMTLRRITQGFKWVFISIFTVCIHKRNCNVPWMGTKEPKSLHFQILMIFNESKSWNFRIENFFLVK